MIEAIVSLNGEDFTVLVPGDVYDAERLDFNAAVQRALAAHHQDHPLEHLDVASLDVRVRRVHQDRAARDGVGVDAE